MLATSYDHATNTYTITPYCAVSRKVKRVRVYTFSDFMLAKAFIDYWHKNPVAAEFSYQFFNDRGAQL